jgi:hypothetical protein
MRKIQLVASMLALFALVGVSSTAFAAPDESSQTASPLTTATTEPVNVSGYTDGDTEVHAAQYYPYYYPYYGYSYPYYSSYMYPYYGYSYSYPYYASYSYPYYGSYLYPYYGYGYRYPSYGYGWWY